MGNGDGLTGQLGVKLGPAWSGGRSNTAQQTFLTDELVGTSYCRVGLWRGAGDEARKYIIGSCSRPDME